MAEALPERLMTAVEVAELLGTAPRYVRALAREQRIPAVRVGARYVRFHPAAIAAWLAANSTACD